MKKEHSFAVFRGKFYRFLTRAQLLFSCNAMPVQHKMTSPNKCVCRRSPLNINAFFIMCEAKLWGHKLQVASGLHCYEKKNMA